MIDLENFKFYLGYGRDGSRSYGLLRLTRRDPSDQTVISIPKGTTFYMNRAGAPALVFVATQDYEIGESATFLPIGVESVAVGEIYNIQAGQDWQVFNQKLNITNQAIFSGGADVIKPDSFDAGLPVADSVLQSLLDCGIELCRRVCGFEDATENPTTESFKNSCFFAGRYYLQRRSVFASEGEWTADNIITQKILVDGVIDDKTHMGFLRILRGMLAGHIQVENFMPGEDE